MRRSIKLSANSLVHRVAGNGYALHAALQYLHAYLYAYLNP
jgi:hypothetical protein